jgi:hypothetical protein
MTKFTVVLTTLFLTMSSITADKVHGLRSGPPGDEGPRGTRRLMHDHDHGHGGRKGGFGEKNVPTSMIRRWWTTRVWPLSPMTPTAPFVTASLAPGSAAPCSIPSRENPTLTPLAATLRARFSWMTVFAARVQAPSNVKAYALWMELPAPASSLQRPGRRVKSTNCASRPNGQCR